MKKNEAEEATYKLFDKLVAMMEEAEERILRGEGKLPKGLEDQFMQLLEDVSRLRRGDREIRKSLGINEQDFQDAVHKIDNIKGPKKNFLERMKRFEQDLELKIAKIRHELKQAEKMASIPDENIDEIKKKVRSKDKFKKIGGKDSWLAL